MNNKLPIFEQAVLEKLLDGDFPLLIQLRQQLARCTVAKREFTGFGFYTTLSVPADVRRTVGLDVKFGDVVGKIPELPSGAGFLLYVKNGVLDMLEGYSYDEPWPSSIDNFSLEYVKGEQRDLTALEGSLRQKS
ncbi:hypothetical protein [Parazoarcus communis]|uniref:Uncharacterized protein n=1 Tax=Parazoarcus communis SWub3 = DSM 12120 TaxID=1121029 RepID=A0A323UQI5_9RHOO|nr:hypothetical protein [Parazoarcus communis]NMG72897.1 hypothetical protein [Parazoarcus communis SWub3 = DSM 12120]PZA14283.1 hypothetical protein DNK49_22690 [Azoarcus communis] [Parazoarcus communis SWub3 = DSM 12120]